MQKVSLVFLALLALPLTASATSVAWSPWYARVQGTVEHQGRPVDLRDELDLRNSASHGVVVDGGWLRLGWMPLKFSGVGTLQGDAQFGGATFSDESEVRTSADITDLSARFLWFFLEDDRLGLGGTVKILDGEFEVEETQEDGQSDEKTFARVFPMLSAAYTQPLPTDLMSLLFEADYIGFEDDWVLELSASVTLQTKYMQIRMGWLQKQHDISDDDSQLDSKTKGAFAQLIFDLG